MLAGEAYQDGVNVLPLSFGGYMLYGGYTVLAAGLFLHRKTGRISVAAAAAVALNVGLNLILVPKFGILGAAIATAASYLMLVVALGVMSFRFLSFSIDWAYLLRVCAMSAVMVLSILWIDLGSHPLTLLARVVVGAVVILGLALGVDRRGRALVKEMLRPGAE